ncbi:MAG: DUF1499 domain-containing protein [Methylocystis sp.]|jgi:uncharacterized protein (DUF1499 family)
MRRHLPPEPVSRAAIWSRRLGLFAALVAALAVGLARAHKLEAQPALIALGASVALALTAVLMFCAACVGIWRWGGRGVGAAVAGMFLATATLAYPAYLSFEAVRLPVLADISTDIQDPPDFSRSLVALKARGGFTPSSPPNAERAQQRAAYPDVAPILLDLDLDEASAVALKAATARGWRLVDQRPASARSGDAHMDFMDRTTLMGLDEDVTVRLRPLAGQTRIDIRAASRHGRHDFGSNARRIARFAEELQAQVDQR